MKYLSQLLRFKWLYWFILISSLFFIYCSSAIAITLTKKHPKKLTSTKHIRQTNESVYLLDWQKNKLSTTAGVFMLNDEIEIIDENNVKEALSSEPRQRHNHHKLHRVILKKEGRRLVRITIK